MTATKFASLLLLSLLGCGGAGGDRVVTSADAVSPQEGSGPTDCSVEFALSCDSGLIDACLLPSPPASFHICVAQDSATDSIPCAQELSLVCGEGLADGCARTPATRVHVCAAP